MFTHFEILMYDIAKKYFEKINNLNPKESNCLKCCSDILTNTNNEVSSISSKFASLKIF